MSYRGVVLPASLAAFVEAGGRDLALRSVQDAGELEAARPVRLVSQQGRPLGLALADPENDRLRLLLRVDEEGDAIGPPLFAARVEQALALRRSLGLPAETTAFRAIHGAGDGLPGFAADVLDAWAVVHVCGRAFVPHGQELARALIDAAHLRGCVVKVRSRGAASQGRVRQEIVGEAPPERLVVREREVPFEVHLDRGINTGLFTDMREHRHRLGRLAPAKRVLNGFSYTGSLSVVVARAGASSVTSVDLSAGVQAWARDNFRLSGLRPESPAFRFEVQDVGRFLEDASRAGRRFDLLLLDPPAFSAARGAAFALDRDFPQLVARACHLLPPGGLLWLTCNARTSDLAELSRQGLALARREATLLELGGLPADHPTLPAQPQDRYLQVALFRLG
jgi:23S rRNA (cytosine1962-C5)-methyltransferase